MKRILLVLCFFWFIPKELYCATIVSNVTQGFWNNTSSWVGGVIPQNGDDVIIADGARIIFNSGSISVSSLSIGQTGGLSNDTYLTVAAGNNFTVTGNVLIESGLEDEFFGSSEYALRIGSGSTGADFTIGGNLIINTTLDQLSGVRLTGASNLSIAGNMVLPNNAGFLNPGISGSTVTGTSSSFQLLYIGGGISYENLIIQATGATILNSTGASGTVNRNLSIESGVFDNNNISVTVGGNVSVAAGATAYVRGNKVINTGGTFTLDGTLNTENPSGFSVSIGGVDESDISLGSSATLGLNGSTAQFTGFGFFSTPPTFASINFGNSAGVTVDGSFTTDNLTISSGTLNGGDYDIVVNNTWTNNGTFVPGNSTVTFNGTTSFAASASETFHGLTVGSGGIVTAPTTLTISGDLMVESGGSFDNNGGTVVFEGGTTSSTTSGVVQFENVTLNQGVVFAGADTINGILAINSGSSNITGSLALDLNTGYVDPSGTASISGDINFFKSVSHNNYTYLSFPVSTTVANLKSFGFQKVYAHDQSQTQPWISQSNATTLNPDGTGYACGILNGTPEVSISGTYNNTRTNVSLTLNSSGTGVGDAGYNMIGNPYPFNLDWELLMLNEPDASDLYNAIYYNVGGSYLTYIGGVPNGQNIIPPFQGFMVYLSNSTGSPTSSTFNFNRGSAATGSDEGTKALYRTTPITDVLKLEIGNGNVSDATYIRLSDDATTEFDGKFDAFKKKNDGQIPSFYSYLGQNIYSINSVPATFDNFTLPLAFEAKVAGSYTITLSEEYAYYLPYEIVLEDKYLGVMYSLSSNPEYTFETDLTENIGRFAIHFKNPVITSNIQAQYSDVRVFSSQNKVYVEGLNVDEASSQVKVFDLTGRELKSFNNVDIRNKSFTFDILSEAGVYIVNIQSGKKSYSEKVVIY